MKRKQHKGENKYKDKDKDKDKNGGNTEKNQAFFKSLASLYAEKSGNELKREMKKLEELNNSPQTTDSADEFDKFQNFERFKKKVKNAIRAEKIKKYIAPILAVTACCAIVIAVFVNSHISDFFRSYNSLSSTYEKPSEILTYEFISEKLPAGYTLKKLDYDRRKAIYYIAVEEKNEIILTIEEFDGNIRAEGLEEININNTNAYALSKEDYSFLQCKKENLLYTFTSSNSTYYGLIELGKNLI